MKVYIAGSMTGFEYFNFPAFDKAKTKLLKKGYEIFSPADHDRALLGKPVDWLPTEADSIGPWKQWSPHVAKNLPTLRDMLGADLAWIAKEADAIYMLKGWERSFGANAEWALARALGLQIIYQ